MSSPEAVALRRESTELLGRAVHRNRSLSREGLLERAFTTLFSGLVYPMIWEDPRVDLEALALTPQSRMVTIASGGCNVLGYLAAGSGHGAPEHGGPERIHAVDLNSAHIALNRLKIEAFRRIADREQLYAFLGAADERSNIDLYDRLIAPHVDPATRAYWSSRSLLGRRRIDGFARGFYRGGLLGRFIAVAHAAAWLNGRDPRRMMRARSRAEQVEIFESELAPLFDSALVRRVLGHRAALYGLGIPPAQYEALLGDERHMADVVRERLRRLACDFDLADNPFAWAAFNRGFARDGHGPNPLYLEPANVERIRSRLDRVTVELVSFDEFLAQRPADSLDRFVLLDAQDWMGDQDLSRLWTEITRTARPGARVIFRTAGRDTILPGRVPQAVLDRWHYDAARSLELHEKDRSAIYGGFHLYVHKGA